MSSHHGEEHAIHVPQPSFSPPILGLGVMLIALDRKSTRLNSSHSQISYAVFCLKKKNNAHYSVNGPNRSHHGPTERHLTDIHRSCTPPQEHLHPSSPHLNTDTRPLQHSVPLPGA